jgi:hypothetical protein
MSRQYGSLLLIGAVVAGAACGNAGADKLVSITATGSIRGTVYSDDNGSGALDGSDRPIPGVTLRVIPLGTRDTVARPVTGADGGFATARLAVGRYVLVVPDDALGDSVEIVQFEDSVVTLLPDGEAAVTIGLGFPTVSIAAARALPAGRKLFVTGIALTSLGVFGDTTTHVGDASGAIRATRVQRAVQLTGDSVRLRGTMATRDGQPVIDDPQVFVLAIGRPVPPPEAVATGVAASADGGRLDAALARLAGITVADTVTTAAGFVLTADDGSGAVEVLLDADVSFDLAGLEPAVVVDVTGVLVPSGAGIWVLKPRSDADIVIR